MSYAELTDRVDIFTYYCLLAEALDAEELEEYNHAAMTAIAFHKPGKINKWKWSSPDRAGTKPSGTQEITNSIAGFVVKQTGGRVEANGSAEEFARVTGRPLAYVDEAGNLFDSLGNPTEKTPSTIVIPMQRQ